MKNKSTIEPDDNPHRQQFFAAFDNVREEDLLFVMPYSLTKSGMSEKTDGILGATIDTIYTYDSITGQKQNLDFTDIEKFKIHLSFGTVGIDYIDKNGDNHALILADMSMKKQYAYAVKLFNFRLRHNVLKPDGRNRRTICEKCRRPFAPGAETCFHCMDKRRHLKWMWSLIRPYQLFVYIALVLFVAITGLNILLPHLNRIVIDEFIRNPETPVLWQFVIAILSIVAVGALIRFVGFLRRLALLKIQVRLGTEMREMMFEKIQKLSLTNINRRTTGSLIHRVNHDTRAVLEFIIHEFSALLDQILLFIVITIILVMYDPWLAVIIIAPVPFIMVAFRLFNKKIRRMFDFVWEMGSQAGTVMQDIFQGIRVVKSFGMEKREIQRYDAAAKGEYDAQINAELFWAKTFPFLIFFMGIGEFFLLYYVGTQILDGRMTLGEMTMFTAYAMMLFGPLRWLSNMPQRIIRTMVSLARIHDIIEDLDTMDDSAETQAVDIKGEIVFEDVGFNYEDAQDVLHSVNLTIKPGEMIGIVGRSGVGKSTLTNLVMRLYDVTEGSIKIDGHDIRDIPQHTLRSQVGTVLQETFLFVGSIYDNIAYAKPDATREEIIEAAKAACAHEFIVALPDGYNTYVGERGHTVSGGERQRIAIARALLHNPRILILDEATSALDTETEKLIQDALARLIANRTTIAIAHRLSTLRNATKILVMDKGTVAEVGTHDELMEKSGIYHGLVMAQRQMSKMAPIGGSREGGGSGKKFGTGHVEEE